MGPLIVAQFMAAAVLFAVGLLHLLIWHRLRDRWAHLIFAFTALGIGANALLEAAFYRAETIAAFNTAFKWANSLNCLWAIGITWFIVVYARSGSTRRWLPLAVTAIFGFAAVANLIFPYGFLYSQITSLKQLVLPWGESIVVAEGTNSPWRILSDVAQLGVLGMIVDGTIRLSRRGRSRSALLVGGSLTVFMLSMLMMGLLVDMGAVSFPYLFTYGYLAVALAMTYELVSEAVRAAALSKQVRANELRWRSLLEDIHLLVVSLNRAGRIGSVNPFFTTVSGYEPEDVLDKPFHPLVSTDDRARSQLLFDDAMAGGGEAHVELTLKTSGGTEKVITWSNVLLRDPDGQATGVLAVGADITEQKRTEGERDAAFARVEEALQQVEEFKRRLEEEVIYLKEEITSVGRFDEIVGESDALQYVLHKVEQVGPLDTTVLIEGETGVGKELVARAIHSRSPRHDRAMIKVNCATLPADLIEAELFGHERGAFTGATRLRRGRFELAHRGTLFLDEVSELPTDLQGKLLRVLQEGEYERVGSERTQRADVRVIAATNRNLHREVQEGRFREDLYYRLNVYPLTVPTLAQRRSDIPLLVRTFVRKFSKAQGKSIDGIPQPVMDELTAYAWPGNVRELQNVIERAVITSQNDVLALAAKLAPSPKSSTVSDSQSGYDGPLADVERGYILRVLRLCEWRIEGEGAAAELLGLHPNTLRSRLQKLGIRRPGQPEPPSEDPRERRSAD